MPLTTLTLIGTVHRDPRGEERLLAHLRRLRPDLVTLEMSEKAFVYRQGNARLQLLRLERILVKLAGELGVDVRELEGHPAVCDIRTLLGFPFEYQAASAYAAEAAIPLHLIDLSEISVIKLKKVESDLITYRNIRVLVSLPPRNENTGYEGYETARALIAKDPGEAVRRAFLEGRRGEEGIGGRDRWMARQIRLLLEVRRTSHLVHIGGWVHMIEDERGETLYSLLRDLNPVRELLG